MLDYFMVSECDGGLYDTRKPGWAYNPPLRAGFSRTHRTINNARELCATLRAGAYTFPGGYTIALYTDGGEMASIAGLLVDRSALRTALWDIRHGMHGRIIGADTYDEGPTVQCCYTNRDIESSYGDPYRGE